MVCIPTVLVLALWPTFVEPKTSNTMSLAALTAALEFQLSSIESVEAIYDHAWEPDPLLKASGLVSNGPHRVEWCERETFFCYKKFRSDDQVCLLFATAYDGVRGYVFDAQVRNGQRHADDPGRLLISTDPNSSFRQTPTPAYAIGRRVAYTDSALSELMRLPGSSAVGSELVNAHACQRVDIVGFAATAGEVLKLSAYLDPECGYLPARISVSYDSSDESLQPIHQTWDVPEFMSIVDQATGVEHWFPRVAVLSQKAGGTHTLTIESAKINVKLPQERFTVKVPDGTIVTDTAVGRKPRTYIAGGPDAEQRMVLKAAALAQHELGSAATERRISIDARPRRGSLVPWMLIAVSIAFTSASILWFRSR